MKVLGYLLLGYVALKAFGGSGSRAPTVGEQVAMGIHSVAELANSLVGFAHPGSDPAAGSGWDAVFGQNTNALASGIGRAGAGGIFGAF